jgi:hypothetical protein
MSKTSNNQKIATLKIWLEELKKKTKPKKKVFVLEDED